MIWIGKPGANDGDRTRDNRYHKPALYQLSYVRHQGSRKYCFQLAAVNNVSGLAEKCRARRATASSSTVSCLQKAKRA